MPKSILGLVWSPPKPMRYKLNFDGVVFAEQNAARPGVIIRNEERLLMVATSQQRPLPSTVLEVEVLAARRALEFSQELGLARVILEGDSKILIKSF